MRKRTVLYTQRVEEIQCYQERRDCADQNIPRFLEACGFLPVPIPNVIQEPGMWASLLQPAGIVLTGGNSLEKYGGTAPERDRTDHCLIETALKHNIPIYGFCRGMQSILDYFGCRLENVQHHVAVRHLVHGIWGDFLVNSYHNLACREITGNLEIMAQAEDGVIEAIISKSCRVMATMWHPEREKPFTEEDLQRVKEFFN